MMEKSKQSSKHIGCILDADMIDIVSWAMVH